MATKGLYRFDNAELFSLPREFAAAKIGAETHMRKNDFVLSINRDDEDVINFDKNNHTNVDEPESESEDIQVRDEVELNLGDFTSGRDTDVPETSSDFKKQKSVDPDDPKEELLLPRCIPNEIPREIDLEISRTLKTTSMDSNSSRSALEKGDTKDKRSAKEAKLSKKKPSRKKAKSVFERLYDQSKSKHAEGKKRRDEMTRRQHLNDLYRSGAMCKKVKKVSVERGSELYYRGMVHLLQKERLMASHHQGKEPFKTKLNLHQIYDIGKVKKSHR